MATEIIDGESFELTPVIPASTNTPAGGARPYPTAANKPRAIWIALKRFAQELDKFESTVIRTLTDRVVGVEKAVAATSPQRRALVANTSQALNNQTDTRIILTSDAFAGDVAPSTGGIKVDAAGIITATDAGTYMVLVNGFRLAVVGAALSVRVNGKLLWRQGGDASSWPTLAFTQSVAANSTFELFFWNQSGNQLGFPFSNADRNATATTTGGSSTYQQPTPTLSIVRLGA